MLKKSLAKQLNFIILCKIIKQVNSKFDIIRYLVVHVACDFVHVACDGGRCEESFARFAFEIKNARRLSFAVLALDVYMSLLSSCL